MTASTSPIVSSCGSPLPLQSPAARSASDMLQQRASCGSQKSVISFLHSIAFILKAVVPAYLLVCGISTASSGTETTTLPFAIGLLA